MVIQFEGTSTIWVIVEDKKDLLNRGMYQWLMGKRVDRVVVAYALWDNLQVRGPWQTLQYCTDEKTFWEVVCRDRHLMGQGLQAIRNQVFGYRNTSNDVGHRDRGNSNEVSWDLQTR